MDPKKEKYKRVRGAMLKLLAHQHPGVIDFKVLHFLLDDLGYTIREEECQSHIFYLEEKGFVHRDLRKTGGVEIEMIRISAKGLDVLDGLVVDVGVDVRF